MKINRLTSLATIIIGLLISALASSFFMVERNMMLRTVAEDLNQNLFYIEGELRNTLETKPVSEIQGILDQAVAVNQSVEVLSVSLDGVHVAVSSSRALKGKALNKKYLPIKEMTSSILNGDTDYRESIHYYDNSPSENHAVLLIEMNKTYIFDRMNKIAFWYGLGLFLALSMITAAAYLAVRKVISLPLERMIGHARSGSTQSSRYFIEEFTEMDSTLSDTFSSLQQQSHALQKSLAQTTYLDGVLRTVADINQLLITSDSTRELMDQSVARLARHPGYALCMILRESQAQLVVSACSMQEENAQCHGYAMVDMSDRESKNPLIRAFQDRKTVVIEQLLSDEHDQDAAFESVRFWAKEGNYGALVVLPLLPSVHSAPIGVLCVYAQRSSGFDLQEIAMLEELAGDIGFATRAFEQREQLQHHLTTDSNTGLLNRVAFIDHLGVDAKGLIGLVNIDRFSDINAVYGVAMGDALLKQFGQWLEARVRGRKDTHLYKMGGDEFALYFSSTNSLTRVRPFFDELITATANAAFMVEGVEIVLTITVGVAPAADRGLAHAAAAIKQAKLNHQSICLFDGLDATKQQENNIAWYKRIRDAIETSRIVPYFQPIVDNKTQAITKYEALIRMIDLDGQVISPYQFLDIAKKTKLYSQLTRMMVDKVLAVFKESTVPVSINLSTEDLLNQELSDYLELRLTETGMGRLVLFEILESEGVNNYEAVSAFIHRFKAKGCLFAIDDFGSGYSNFDHLIKLNMDILKIDGSLIRTLPHDRNTQIIVQHICDFAHEMGIRTVAEFVSNEAIYRRVCEIGIDESQGYYFHEPLERPF